MDLLMLFVFLILVPVGKRRTKLKIEIGLRFNRWRRAEPLLAFTALILPLNTACFQITRSRQITSISTSEFAGIHAAAIMLLVGGSSPNFPV